MNRDKAAAKGNAAEGIRGCHCGYRQGPVKTMDVSYDRFIRATDDYHVKSVQKIFTKLHDQVISTRAPIYGMYCKPCESFLIAQLERRQCPDRCRFRL